MELKMLFGLVVIFLTGCNIGYRFCKHRYMIDSMLELNRIQTALINNEITAEEAIERIEAIETKEKL